MPFGHYIPTTQESLEGCLGKFIVSAIGMALLALIALVQRGC